LYLFSQDSYDIAILSVRPSVRKFRSWMKTA